jgi:hypothetical protein
LWLPWPSIFVFLGVYGIATLVLLHVYLAESLPVRQSLHPLAIARNYAQLFRSPVFLVAIFASGLIYAGLWAFAPFDVAIWGGCAAIIIGILVTVVYCWRAHLAVSAQ